MRTYEIKPSLSKILLKVLKKDKVTYEQILKKIKEIMKANVNHYKNLRKPLQHLKRVHIKGPFVLTFQYIESEDRIVFYDFDHHDNIYK